jgi:hypothetical protein
MRSAREARNKERQEFRGEFGLQICLDRQLSLYKRNSLTWMIGRVERHIASYVSEAIEWNMSTHYSLPGAFRLRYRPWQTLLHTILSVWSSGVILCVSDLWQNSMSALQCVLARSVMHRNSRGPSPKALDSSCNAVQLSMSTYPLFVHCPFFSSDASLTTC